MWFDQLAEEQRLAIVLLNVYQAVRREASGAGYWAPIPTDMAGVGNPVFKSAVTAVKFLLSHGWRPGLQAVHWQGYIKYVFERMLPATIPQPGQLCNPILLKEYCAGTSHTVNTTAPGRTDEQLRQIYDRVLRREVGDCTATRLLLGLP